MKLKKILLITTCLFLVNITNISAAENLKLNCSKVLRNGATGTNVKALQKMLNSVASCNLRVDGGYGQNTINCVKKYQTTKNLTPDGEVGSKTCNTLNTDYEAKNKNTTKSTTTTSSNKTTTTTKTTTKNNTSTASSCTANTTPLVSATYSVTILGNVVLRKGRSSDNVRLLKQELNKVMNCKLDITKDFDDATYDCVVKFQKKYNLTPDGVVGKGTISELNKAYKVEQAIVINKTSIKKNNNTSSSNVTSVSQGTRLNLLGKCGNNSDWYKVEYNGQIGYVQKSLISLEFIEVDITSQVLRYYKNGNLYVDTIVTTGKYGTNGTPKGYRTVTTKKTQNRLMPSNVVVDYWLGTDSRGAIGIHDASWRGTSPSYSTYGGTIYKGSGEAGTKSSGSHGCINTPRNKVRIIYNNVSVGTPVYIY